MAYTIVPPQAPESAPSRFKIVPPSEEPKAPNYTIVPPDEAPPKFTVVQPTISVRPAAPTLGGRLIQGFTDFPADTMETAHDALNDAQQGLDTVFKARGVVQKGLGALELAGAGVDYVSAPMTGAIRSAFGDPLERATGHPGLSREIGDWGTTAIQIALGLPRAKAAEDVVRTLGETHLATGIKEAVSPTSLAPHETVSLVEKGKPTFTAPQAKVAEYNIRAGTAALAQAREIAAHDLEQFRHGMAQLPAGGVERLPDGTVRAIPGTQVDFIDAIESGSIGRLPPEQQAAAQKLRTMFDTWRDKVRGLGKGYLENAIEDYFPHIWTEPTRAATAQDAMDIEIGRSITRRSLTGRASFLKQRTIGSTVEGMARGLTPVTTNPLDLSLIKLNEMQKFYYGNVILRDMKATGLVRFARNARGVPDGWRALDGNEFRIFAPAMRAEHFAAYDPQLRKGLQSVADFLGIDIKTPLTDKILKSGTYGYTGRSLREVVARFGGDEAILMHEIGHQLDYRYRLAEFFGRDHLAWQELGSLARLRAPAGANIPPEYLQYLLTPAERIANLFHAYWHAPGELRKTAPRAAAILDRFLQSHPDLKAAVDRVKPSVQIKGETREETGIGPQFVGNYYAPTPVHRILSNYLSQGLRGNALYDAVRSAGNSLNQLQLAWPGFHALFVTNDTAVSEMARAAERAAEGEFGRAAKSFLAAHTIVGPVIQAVRAGSKLRSAYLAGDHAPKEMKRFVQALVAGGGRSQDG